MAPSQIEPSPIGPERTAPAGSRAAWMLARLGSWRPGDWFRPYRVYRTLRRVRQLSPAVAIAQGALHDFGDRSSSDFTALAEGLAGLESRLTEVATQSSQLNLILQDQDDDRALHSAFELHRKTVELARTSLSLALTQEERMAQMEARLFQNRDRFSQNRLKFRVLVMSIRTEASRIDAENCAVFGAVAAEIEAMEQQMNTLVEAAFAELEDIVHEAADGREHLKKLQGSLHRRALQSGELLRAGLNKLKLDLAPCAEASGHITQLLGRTRAQTSDLITSLQYQDIVRQQLDHVSQGLNDIAGHLEPAAAETSADLAYLHHAARVQRTHLGTSRRAIEKAGGEIEMGGSALLATGAALAARFTEMEHAATAVFGGSRVSELFAQEAETLSRISRLGESTHERIAHLLERIEKSIQSFSVDIRRHELKVQLVALNSQIAAARVPTAGALNRLAEEISQHSADTAQLTEAMSAQLGDALERLRGSRGEDERVQATVSRERADVARDSLAVREKLTRLDERLRRSSDETARDFHAAYECVRELLPRLSFPSLIASSYTPAEDLCDSLLAATEAFSLPDELDAEGSTRLAAHRSRYTMRAEHEAHAGAVAARSSALTTANFVGQSSRAGPEGTTTGSAATGALFDSRTQTDSACSASDSSAPDLSDRVELF